MNERGEPIVGDTLLLMFNTGDDAITFVLPATTPLERWKTSIDRPIAGCRCDA